MSSKSKFVAPPSPPHYKCPSQHLALSASAGPYHPCHLRAANLNKPENCAFSVVVQRCLKIKRFDETGTNWSEGPNHRLIVEANTGGRRDLLLLV